MSELSTSEARKLMEVYTSMCAPQQENLSEEVEQIDEKMDVFSAIKSTPSPVFTGQKPAQQPRKGMEGAFDKIVSDTKTTQAAATKFFTKEPAGGKPATPATPARAATPATPARSATPATAKPAPSSVVLAKKGGVEGKLDKSTGKFTAGAFTGAEKARYTARGGSAAPTNVAKVAPTRPAAPAKPATGMLGKTSFERRTPTSAELKAAQAARASGASPEKALQAAKAAGTTAKIQSAGQSAGAKAFSSPTPGASAFKAPEVKQTAALAATPKPTPVAPRQTAREKMLNQSYEYDAFDLVLEYLIDNGHVETVDEALYVMMEMDAEVIRDIVEEVINEDAKYDKNRRRAAQRAAARNAARDAGQTGAVPGVGYVTPRRERETYTDSAGTERHKTGAKMPKKD
jgi:hypothetical protein